MWKVMYSQYVKSSMLTLDSLQRNSIPSMKLYKRSIICKPTRIQHSVIMNSDENDVTNINLNQPYGNTTAAIHPYQHHHQVSPVNQNNNMTMMMMNTKDTQPRHIGKQLRSNLCTEQLVSKCINCYELHTLSLRNFGYLLNDVIYTTYY